MKQNLSRLMPLLVGIQANLEEELRLAALARRIGLSESHFHRLFTRLVGESPRAYVTRLRVEQGAFRLIAQDATVLRIALECGFRNHETFTRAFRRRYRLTPSRYRQVAWRRARSDQDASILPAAGFELSATRVVRFKPLNLAFLRHIGPYETVPDSLFHGLERWAVRRQLPGPRIWMGLGHDAPSGTAASKLRFDAALVVAAPFRQEGKIGWQQLPGGEYAVTTHVGAFATLPSAYRVIFPRLLRLKGYRVIGLPAVEIYHTARIDGRQGLLHTDICLPVERRILAP